MTTILSYFELLFWVLGRGLPQFKRIEYHWMCIWDGVFINLISISDHHSQSRCWTQLGNNLWKNIKESQMGTEIQLLCKLNLPLPSWVNIFVNYGLHLPILCSTVSFEEGGKYICAKLSLSSFNFLAIEWHILRGINQLEYCFTISSQWSDFWCFLSASLVRGVL